MKVVKVEFIRSDMKSWDALFKKAADFATSVGPDRLINISHSADLSNAVIAIWYWSETDDES